MAQHGGDIATARLLWTQMYKSTEDKSLRANAIKRLQALQVDEDVPLLESVLQQYKGLAGRYPANWAELQATGWRGPTVDPAGNPYRIMADGRVQVEDPDKLPFISKGLPAGVAPSIMSPTTRKQQDAIKEAVEQSTDSHQEASKPNK
jgi:hypothetical protein